MTTINRTFLDHVRAYCEKATEGPWQCDSDFDIISSKFNPPEEQHHGLYETVCAVSYGSPDGPFIASSRTDLPLIIAALEEAWKSIEEKDGRIAELTELCRVALHALEQYREDDFVGVKHDLRGALPKQEVVDE